MNIIFSTVPTNTVTGRINIEDGVVESISGSAIVYLNSWTRDGGTLRDFEEYYSSWSNGYVRSDSEAGTLEPTIAFTVDDDGNVLELIRSDVDGIHVRENGEWTLVNGDEEQPTIDDQEWLDVSEDAVTFWDENADSADSITRDDVVKYAIDSE